MTFLEPNSDKRLISAADPSYLTSESTQPKSTLEQIEDLEKKLNPYGQPPDISARVEGIDHPKARHLADEAPGGEFNRLDPKRTIHDSIRFVMASMHNEVRSRNQVSRTPKELAMLARLDPYITSQPNKDDHFRFLDEYAQYVNDKESRREFEKGRVSPHHRKES